MPHKPRANCVPCHSEMVIQRTGARAEMTADPLGSLYKINGDIYRCPVCGTEVLLLDTHTSPVTHRDQVGYAQVPTDLTIRMV